MANATSISAPHSATNHAFSFGSWRISISRQDPSHNTEAVDFETGLRWALAGLIAAVALTAAAATFGFTTPSPDTPTHTVAR